MAGDPRALLRQSSACMLLSKSFRKRGIPVSLSLFPSLAKESMLGGTPNRKHRMVYIAALAVLVGACISVLAKLLVYLINIITNLSFFGSFSLAENSPAHHGLGLWVILIPAAGGLVIGLMAYYGSKAIRGHGIPEAMEQILTNNSKIKPSITFLKPVSSAISIGTGGPFGAEGPIIATGGALGSTLGQLLKITHYERKVLLAAGATAGMAAIFGSPIAAIFLAVELLLFEFSPKSLIPVALACITGAAGHHLLFAGERIFALHHELDAPSNTALLAYSLFGILLGFISVLVTKFVYKVEDLFEKLPLHWMWWPAIGGLFVGLIGFFAPNTLGVGYENISKVLSGDMLLSAVWFLCVMKFLSWVIALGSGTSGGTLAPMLTIGGALGALMGSAAIYLFPDAGISLSMAALVGMSALFAGASRALLTSIIFALETTGQVNALLPLLAACAAAYFISFFLMENTIMTEKIARRGVVAPEDYQSDILLSKNVASVMNRQPDLISEDNTLAELRQWLEREPEAFRPNFIVTAPDQKYSGVLKGALIFDRRNPDATRVDHLMRPLLAEVSADDTLRTAMDKMAEHEVEILPVTSHSSGKVTGVLTYRHILQAFKSQIETHRQKPAAISLKRSGLRIIVHGRNLVRR